MERIHRLQKNYFSITRILQSKIFISLGFVVLILISITLSKEILRRHEISRKIESLKSEVTSLEKKNIELGSLIEYLKTLSFKEKEARARLGLQKPGENVISLPQENTNEKGLTSNGEDKTDNSVTADSAPKKWWNYFFY